MNTETLLGAAGVVLAIIGQTGAFVYWAGKLSARVEEHSKRLSSIDGKLDRHIESHLREEA